MPLPGTGPDDMDIRSGEGQLAARARCAPRHERVKYLMDKYNVGDYCHAFALEEVIMFRLTPWRKKEGGSGGQPAPRGGHPLARLRDEFDTLFDRFFSGWPAPFLQRGWGLNVEETDKEVVVRAEAPGFEAQDFDVQLGGNLLTLRAEHEHEAEEKRDDYRTVKRRQSRFERTVTLPAGIDRDRVEARYRNGVLEVRVGKTPEAQGKRIEVKP
jgi:HSP20 family protein